MERRSFLTALMARFAAMSGFGKKALGSGKMTDAETSGAVSDADREKIAAVFADSKQCTEYALRVSNDIIKMLRDENAKLQHHNQQLMSQWLQLAKESGVAGVS